MSNNNQFWYTEFHTEDVGITCKMTKTLHTEKTNFQELALIETSQFGKALILDGAVQATTCDEFVYHEMITHIPLFTHPNPKNALVIGGGDGGAIREILKHKTIEKAVLVEIDEKVITASKKFLPEISCSLDDAKVQIKVTDGIKYIRNKKEEFDCIIADSIDPICIDEGLFELGFYKKAFDALTDDGIFIVPTKSPFYHQDLIKRVFDDINSVFPITKLITCPIPTYPSGYWSFTIGSKKYDPSQIDFSNIPDLDTKYYCSAVHQSAFMLPKFVLELIGDTK